MPCTAPMLVLLRPRTVHVYGLFWYLSMLVCSPHAQRTILGIDREVRVVDEGRNGAEHLAEGGGVIRKGRTGNGQQTDRGEDIKEANVELRSRLSLPGHLPTCPMIKASSLWFMTGSW